MKRSYAGILCLELPLLELIGKNADGATLNSIETSSDGTEVDSSSGRYAVLGGGGLDTILVRVEDNELIRRNT